MTAKQQTMATRQKRTKANQTISLLEEADKHLAFAHALIDAAERADSRASRTAYYWTNKARGEVIGAEATIDLALRALIADEKQGEA